MNEKVHYSLLIEHYINGEMDEEQAGNFLLRLKEDKDLAAEYKFEQDLSVAISDEDTLELRKKLMKMMQESKTKTTVLRYIYSRPYQYAAAAVIILLISAVSLVFLMPHKPSNERLFSSYYNSEQPIRITRGSGTDLMEALRLFQNKEFQQANDYFSLILQGDPNNSAVRFYSSICFIETSQYDQAITQLSQIAQNPNSLYRKSAEWYLALCYLRINQTEKAVGLFRQIADDHIHDYQKDAIRILEELNQI